MKKLLELLKRGLNHLGDFQYGTEILLNNIISLSEGTFKEEFITSIKPNFKKIY